MRWVDRKNKWRYHLIIGSRARWGNLGALFDSHRIDASADQPPTTSPDHGPSGNPDGFQG